MSKEARNRALEAICNAQGRTFLAAAPLMAIVEAVQVLDEAGLLVDPDVADLDPDEPFPYTVSAPGPTADDLLSRIEFMRGSLDDAAAALHAGGYSGSLAEMISNVMRDLNEKYLEVCGLRAATPCEVHFVFEQKPDGDKVFIEAEVGGQSVSVGEWQPDPDEARYVRLVAQVVFSRVESPPAPEPERHILAGSPCFECGQTLNDSGVCTNPKCQSMPF